MTDPIRRYKPTLANDNGDEELWKHVVILTHDEQGPAVLFVEHEERMKALKEQLDVAVELFEMTDECNQVGTDSWVWLQHAREALEAK